MPKALRLISIEGNIAFIPLTRGHTAVIDVADVPLVEGFNWSALVLSRHVYAYRQSRAGGVLVTTYMHRLLADPVPDGIVVDHIDCDSLNNRRSNLRLASRLQNQCNMRLRLSSKSGAKGVSWNSRQNAWEARIQINGQPHFLGYHPTISEASAAYAKASLNLHGQFGRIG